MGRETGERRTDLLGPCVAALMVLTACGDGAIPGLSDAPTESRTSTARFALQSAVLEAVARLDGTPPNGLAPLLERFVGTA